MTTGKTTHLEVVRFGEAETLDVPARRVLTFPQGLVGMEHLRAFALLDDDRIAPCRWLQSIDEPSLAFVVVDPRLVDTSYEAHVPEEDAAALKLDSAADAELWTLVTVHTDPAQSTVNLLAPVVINRRRRLGMQVILHESTYSLRHPIGSPPSPRSLDTPAPTDAGSTTAGSTAADSNPGNAPGARKTKKTTHAGAHAQD